MNHEFLSSLQEIDAAQYDAYTKPITFTKCVYAAAVATRRKHAMQVSVGVRGTERNRRVYHS